MNQRIYNLLKKTPGLKKLISKWEAVTAQLAVYQLGWPPGHFYSPIPDLADIKRREAEIFPLPPAQIPGVDLNEAGQLRLLHRLSAYYAEQPFADHKQEGVRYLFDNPNYSYGEAIILYAMIRHLRPEKIIETGSGYTSCVILDTNERFCDNRVACTFIEPYPQLLYSLLKPGDVDRVEILPQSLQEIPLARFKALAANDILFIDSSHVCKVGSDVNYLFFEVLPCLADGVYVHFHDIGYPFEYPKQWVYQGRAWNEAYLLRAFLQYNQVFQIQFFNAYLGYAHWNLWADKMPLCGKNPGTSIWLRKGTGGEQ